MRRCECGCGAPLVERSDRIVRFASRQCCGRAKRGVPLTAYPGFMGGVFFDAHERRWRIRCRDGTTEVYARAVMEAELKRPLTSEEIVHHENEEHDG